MAQPRNLGRDSDGKRVWHLDKDPNDPRLNEPATTGFSLNKDDPEQKPQTRKPVPEGLLKKEG